MNIRKPQLSVVMPVYNGSVHLRASLESISRQTYRDFEAIVVDDGSTDDTPRLLDKWARRDPRFRIIRHPTNRNVACARNTGLDAAQCTLVAQADADDVNHPERFAAQMQAAERHPEMGIIGTDLSRSKGGTWRFPASSEAIRARLLWEPPFGQPAVLFNRTILGDARYDPGLAMCEDIDFWLRNVFRVPTMNLPEALVHYTQPDGSLSKNLSARRMEIERLMMRRRAALLGIELDLDAGLAANLGNCVVHVRAMRIAAHIGVVCQQAAACGIAPPPVLRNEGMRLCGKMWRYYGRQHLRTDLLHLGRATLSLLTQLTRLPRLPTRSLSRPSA